MFGGLWKCRAVCIELGEQQSMTADAASTKLKLHIGCLFQVFLHCRCDELLLVGLKDVGIPSRCPYDFAFGRSH